MKKKVLFISVFIFIILALGSSELNAAKVTRDQGTSGYTNQGEAADLLDDDELLIEWISFEQGGPKIYESNKYTGTDKIFKDSDLESSDLEVSQYQVVGEVEVNEILVFHVIYKENAINPEKAYIDIKFGNYEYDKQIEKDKEGDFAEVQDLGTYRKQKGYFEFYFYIKPKTSTSNMKEQGLNNMWFKIEIFNKQDGKRWHYVYISLRNIAKPEEQQTIEQQIISTQEARENTLHWQDWVKNRFLLYGNA